MRIFFYELRKNYLRKYVILCLLLLSVLDVIKINVDYKQDRIDSVTAESAENIAAYEKMYDKSKGEMTEDTRHFLGSEEERLSEIYENRPNIPDSNEPTYSGNWYEDYRLLEVYIAKEFNYMANYNEYSSRIASLAEDNISYYQKKNNMLKVKENEYIRDTYQNRKITHFYRMDSINSFLNYQFSNILILFLCFIGAAPAFLAEHDCQMDFIIQTSRNGKIKTTILKILAAVCYAVGIVLWFFGLDLITYQVLCGFEALNIPIWSIKDYCESFLNCTIFDFMLQEVVLKILGVILFTLVILFFSFMMKRVLHVALGFLAVLAGFYLLSRYAFSMSKWKAVPALCNPVTLLNNSTLYKGFHYVELGDTFILKSSICVWGSMGMIVLVLVLILIFSWRKCK